MRVRCERMVSEKKRANVENSLTWRIALSLSLIVYCAIKSRCRFLFGSFSFRRSCLAFISLK